MTTFIKLQRTDAACGIETLDERKPIFVHIGCNELMLLAASKLCNRKNPQQMFQGCNELMLLAASKLGDTTFMYLPAYVLQRTDAACGIETLAPEEGLPRNG